MRITTPLTTLALGALLACDSGTGPGFEGNITGQPETVVYTQALGIQLSDFIQTPSGLYMRNVVLGAGSTASTGLTAVVRYSGWLANGRVFDSGQLNVALGEGQVVAGFEEGILGMNVGGERMLILPPQLGYGSVGQGIIPGNAVLIFRIELLALSQTPTE